MEASDANQAPSPDPAGATEPAFSRTSFRSTFRLPHNRATHASADQDIALAPDSGLEASLVALNAANGGAHMTLSTLESSGSSEATGRFNQASSGLERQSVLLPPAGLVGEFSQQHKQQQQQLAYRAVCPPVLAVTQPADVFGGTTAEEQAVSVIDDDRDDNCDGGESHQTADLAEEREFLGEGNRVSASSESEEPGRDDMKSQAPNSGSKSKLPGPLPASSQQQPQQSPQQQLRKYEQRIRALTGENAHLQSELGACRLVFLEYERCLRLVGERKRQTDASVAELLRDRDQAVEDLQSVEKAFSDLHKRFEKSKQLVESLRANEQALGRTLQEQQARLKRNEQKYLTLKAHAEEKLEAANRHIDEQRRASDAELARLQAVLRKAELQAQNLQAQLEQKIQENAELTSICDELIGRVGEDAG